MKYTIIVDEYPYSSKLPMTSFDTLYEAVVFTYSLLNKDYLSTKKNFAIFASKDNYCYLKSKRVATIYRDGSREYYHEILNSLEDSPKYTHNSDIDELKYESENSL